MILKTKLRIYTETVEQAKRIGINNIYVDNMGKNRAASFMDSKETRPGVDIY